MEYDKKSTLGLLVKSDFLKAMLIDTIVLKVHRTNLCLHGTEGAEVTDVGWLVLG